MNNNFISSFLIAAAIVGAAFLGANAIRDFKSADRVVTVKGLAEQEVDADLAIWPLSYQVSGDDLSNVQSEVDRMGALISSFLTERGFSADQITRNMPQITDFQSQGYGSQNGTPFRYRADAVVTLRSDDINGVKQAMSEAGALVTQGVTLVRNYEFQPQFMFTGLNDIKPEMIAEATRNAREAAEQFARDSGANVGSIRRANQGLFSINDRDPYSPEFKKVRVVSTVEFFLVD